MLIEIKDMPQQPIKKLDIHIEFDPASPNGTCVSYSTEPKLHSSIPNVPEFQDQTRNSDNKPDIPSEMLNADF